jgi:hypothetical protein
MAFDVPLQVMGLSAGYAAALGWLERKFPSIKPDHIWVEVAGGVLVTLLPVTIAAHRMHSEQEKEAIHWQTYEGTVWRAFFSSAIPVVLWQLGEAVVRRTELLSYSPDNTTDDMEHLDELPITYDDSQAEQEPDSKADSKANQQEEPPPAPIAAEAMRHIQSARSSAAQARKQVHSNPGLAVRLVSEAHQAAASALMSLARIQGLIAAAAPGGASDDKDSA